MTLPALHVVNEQLRHVPLQAVVEIAELLELAPAEVQDTLSFYGFFKQEQPHGETRAWVCRSISCALRGGEQILRAPVPAAGHPAGRDDGGRQADGGVRRMPGRLRARPLHAGRRSSCTRIWMNGRPTSSSTVYDTEAGIERDTVSEFEPVLLANVDKPDSHTLARLRSRRAAIRRLRSALARCRPPRSSTWSRPAACAAAAAPAFPPG